MNYEIIISLIKKDDICSIDDKMIMHKSILLEEYKAKKCIKEIGKLLDKIGVCLNE